MARIGSESQSDRYQDIRQRALEAAVARLRKEEEELEDACGTNNSTKFSSDC